MSSEFRFVYVTAPSKQLAIELGRSLVYARLAACANVIEGMTSVYWWQGEINQDSEVVLILKTRHEHVAALTRAIKAKHPYDCPCVVALPIVEGNPDYLQWLHDETEAADPSAAPTH